MATRPTRAGRTLTAFFIGAIITFGLVALAGQWKPTLGLDLQGGTRITLIAKGSVTSENLDEARNIIDQRVNGSGVSEADVTTQGNRFIVVEIPGQSRRDLVETVKRQAQLRFRVVARTGAGTATDPSPGGLPTSSPSTPAVPSPSPSQGQSPQPEKSKSAQPKNRAPVLLDKSDKSDGKNGKGEKKLSTSPSPNDSSNPTASPSTQPTDQPTDQPSAPADDPLQWMLNPDEESVAAFNEYTCPAEGAPQVDDDPTKPLITCDANGVKYLLSVAMLEGSQLSSANLLTPGQQNVEYGVDLSFDGAGSKTFGEISDALYGTERQFAIVLDGEVISAPTMNAPIHNGKAQITGSFSRAEAQSLTTSLKFGALPIAFEHNPPVETIGPSLAGDQLRAGVTAGIFGLGLVMLYCLFYYRGLGVVVIASLGIAGSLTYAFVMLLSKTAGFTLTLPGIAGLIVAVGITADSFVVYFERIRDEMRDGRSMRLGAEAGWKRARNTCLAADTVSLLAALVLYIFAAGVVKGFAFALGLSTLIDLVVVFFFTHPMVAFLSRYKFFNSGHKLSGLSAETLGVDALPGHGSA